jgi:hypothetical protein
MSFKTEDEANLHHSMFFIEKFEELVRRGGLQN